MSLCQSDCGDVVLVGLPQTNCILADRQKTPSRFIFFECNTSLPDPIKGSIKPLFDSGEIVYSMPLANFVVNDPTTEDVALDDCSPNDRIISTREITFEDRYALTKTLPTSPVTSDKYFDYNVWDDKNNQRFRLRYGIVYCDGDVEIPKDSSGQPLNATLLVYRSYQRASTQGGPGKWFHKGSIIFQGDPFNYGSKPLFNINDEGITL